MSKKKEIVIVAYQFCPRGRIGTRRWSKFAKYLSKDYRVHIICAKYPYKDRLNWCADVENNENIIIHRISTLYPSFAIQEKRTIIVKAVCYLLNVYPFYKDEAQYWKRSLFKKLDEIRTDNKISHFFVTGAPFTPLYYMSMYKKKHPSINLILDLRDPWMQILKKKYNFFGKLKSQVETRDELKSFEVADKILFVTKTFTKEYKQVYPKLAYKMFTVYNGFDEEDFVNIKPSDEENKIAYAGALFEGRAEGMLLFIKAIQAQNIKTNLSCEVDIYSNQIDEKFKIEISQNYSSFVSFKKPLPQNELFSELKRYKYLITINEMIKPYAFGTKIFEYIALGKKIVLISPEGELYRLLIDQKQFVSTYDEQNILKMVSELFRDFEDNFIVTPQSLYNSFELKTLTSSLFLDLND